MPMMQSGAFIPPGQMGGGGAAPMPGKSMGQIPQPPQAAGLDPASPAGPGIGGAATAEGVQAVMPPEAQPQQPGMGGQPQPGMMGGQQPMGGMPGPLDAPMAGMGQETGQAEAPMQPGAGGQPIQGWAPNSQGQQLYADGMGPVTEQVQQLMPKMAIAAPAGLLTSGFSLRPQHRMTSATQRQHDAGGLLALKMASDPVASVDLERKAEAVGKDRQDTDDNDANYEVPARRPGGRDMESPKPPRTDKIAGLLGNAGASAAAKSGVQSSLETPTAAPIPAAASSIAAPPIASPVVSPGTAVEPAVPAAVENPYGPGGAKTVGAKPVGAKPVGAKPVGAQLTPKQGSLLKFNGLTRSAVGEGGFTPKEVPWSVQGSEAWPDKSMYWGRSKDSILPPQGVTKTKIAAEKLPHPAAMTGAIGVAAGPKINPALSDFRLQHSGGKTITPHGTVDAANAAAGEGGAINYSTIPKSGKTRKFHTFPLPKGRGWAEPKDDWVPSYPDYTLPGWLGPKSVTKAKTASDMLTVPKVGNCARCHQDHYDVEFYKLAHPLEEGGYTHTASCPTNGEPIMLKQSYPNADHGQPKKQASYDPNYLSLIDIPPMSETCRAFLLKAAGLAASQEEFTSMVKDACELDPMIADDLAPLTKMAIWPWLARAGQGARTAGGWLKGLVGKGKGVTARGGAGAAVRGGAGAAAKSLPSVGSVGAPKAISVGQRAAGLSKPPIRTVRPRKLSDMNVSDLKSVGPKPLTPGKEELPPALLKLIRSKPPGTRPPTAKSILSLTPKPSVPRMPPIPKGKSIPSAAGGVPPSTNAWPELGRGLLNAGRELGRGAKAVGRGTKSLGSGMLWGGGFGAGADFVNEATGGKPRNFMAMGVGIGGAARIPLLRNILMYGGRRPGPLGVTALRTTRALSQPFKGPPMHRPKWLGGKGAPVPTSPSINPLRSAGAKRIAGGLQTGDVGVATVAGGYRLAQGAMANDLEDGGTWLKERVAKIQELWKKDPVAADLLEKQTQAEVDALAENAPRVDYQNKNVKKIMWDEYRGFRKKFESGVVDVIRNQFGDRIAKAIGEPIPDEITTIPQLVEWWDSKGDAPAENMLKTYTLFGNLISPGEKMNLARKGVTPQAIKEAFDTGGRDGVNKFLASKATEHAAKGGPSEQGLLSWLLNLVPGAADSPFGQWLASFSPMQQGFLAASLGAFLLGIIGMLAGSKGMGMLGIGGGLLMGLAGLKGPRDMAGYQKMVGMEPEGEPPLDLVHAGAKADVENKGAPQNVK